MWYYKALKDNVLDYETGYSTVENELITPKEKRKNMPNIPDKYFKMVDVNPHNTYYSFGTRFEND